MAVKEETVEVRPRLFVTTESEKEADMFDVLICWEVSHKETQSKSKSAGEFIFAKKVCLGPNWRSKHTLGQDMHLVFILIQAVTVSPDGSTTLQSDMIG